MTTGTPPRRRSPAAPPAEGHRPLRATGYRVPVVLDSEFADDPAGAVPAWTPDPAAPAPMWEEWPEPEPEPEPVAAPLHARRRAPMRIASEPLSESESEPEPEPEPVPVPVVDSWPEPAPEPPAPTAPAWSVPVLDDPEPYRSPEPYAAHAAEAAAEGEAEGEDELRPPRSLYLAALGVRHLRPGVFQRVLLVEGIFALAIVLVLADLASPWLIAVLPIVSAVLVKLHDLVEEGLARARPRTKNSPGGPPGLH